MKNVGYFYLFIISNFVWAADLKVNINFTDCRGPHCFKAVNAKSVNVPKIGVGSMREQRRNLSFFRVVVAKESKELIAQKFDQIVEDINLSSLVKNNFDFFEALRVYCGGRSLKH